MATARLQVVHRHLSFSKLRMNLTASSTSSDRQDEIFRYSVDNPLLNYDERKFYEENGYIVIPNLIENHILDECSRRFLDYCNKKIPTQGLISLVKDISLLKKGIQGEYLYNKLQDILHDQGFDQYIKHPKLLDYVSCFTGPEITGLHSMLINKPPDSGALTSRHPWHQDLYYFPLSPVDRIVIVWTAMEPVTVENGCLVVLPGTHQGELLRHEYPKWEGGVNKGYYGISGLDDSDAVPLLMNKGDTVFFHPLLIHASGANMTKGFRKAISCHYATSNCHYIDTKGTLREEISKEVEEVFESKKLHATKEKFWELKMRKIR